MEFNNRIIKKYLNQDGRSPRISIYSPTHPNSHSQTVNEDRIYYKNELQKIEKQLDSFPKLKNTHRQLVDLIDDSDFWLHQSLSTAILADEDGFESIKLPYEITPFSHIGQQFITSPLLILKNLNQKYYLLDLNLHEPRFYVGDLTFFNQVEGVDMPDPIEEELDIEQRPRSVSSRAGAGTGDGGRIFFGHNEVDESHAHHVTRYLQILAGIINQQLKEDKTPLLLAGTPKVVAEFKSLLKHSNILENEIKEEYDAHREQNLHKAARKAIEDSNSQQRQKIVNRYNETEIKRKVDGETAIKEAAKNGRVDTLLVPTLRITTDSIREDSGQQTLIELPDQTDKAVEFDEILKSVTNQSGAIQPVLQSDFDDSSMKALLRY